ncbi:helix-turn-helix transcriptional regulator [Rothia koreensis]|uniref:helix-turn-helix transcriptional regulator n=1 Tax=Rothia koreensis TaxID=592378 RepID=UPI0037C4FF12
MVLETNRRHFTARVKFSGEPLRLARRMLRQSQADLAKRAGVSRQIVGFLEAGTREHCNPETASAISEALGVDFTALFELKALHAVDAQVQARAA